MMDNRFLVIGNDKKMLSCAELLHSEGYVCDCLIGDEAVEKLQFYSNIVLPLPTVANGRIAGIPLSLREFNDLLAVNQRVFCGNINPEDFDCNSMSYYYDESFLIKNSRLTAQGVLKIILDNVYTDLHSMKIAVIGYGRCGKAIAKLLDSCGASVTSFSRRTTTRALAEDDGMLVDTCAHLADRLSEFEVIVNTVPSNIIDDKALTTLTRDNLYIEVASRPYGFNIANTDKFNFRYVLAESLPGRFTPVSAGKNIAQTVINLM